MAISIKDAAKDAIRSRFFVTLVIINFIEMVVLFIIALVHIRAGLTVKTHCETVGRITDCTSADAPWYYIFNFVLLPVIIFVVNVAVALKSLAMKGRQLALCWLWLMILVGLVIVVLASAMIFHFQMG